MAVAFKMVGFPVWKPNPECPWLIQMFSYVGAYCAICIASLLGKFGLTTYSGGYKCEKVDDEIIVHHLIQVCDRKTQIRATPMAKGWLYKRTVQLISDNGDDYLVLTAQNPVNKLPAGIVLQWKRVRSA